MADLIQVYCADGGEKFARIATEEFDFLYGSQMPRKIYIDNPYFIDVNPKSLPRQPAYIVRLRKYLPRMASVHDWDREDRFEEIMMRAEEVAQYVESVILIPKVPGGIRKLPEWINGKRVILGYSVPTKHGATTVPIEEFSGWPVHLLGGSPQAQMKLYLEMSKIADVVSVDGNYHHKMAVKYCQFWVNGTAAYARNHYWPRLTEADGKRWGDGSKSAGAIYEAFRRSCENISQAWQHLQNNHY